MVIRGFSLRLSFPSISLAASRSVTGLLFGSASRILKEGPLEEKDPHLHPNTHTHWPRKVMRVTRPRNNRISLSLCLSLRRRRVSKKWFGQRISLGCHHGYFTALSGEWNRDTDQARNTYSVQSYLSRVGNSTSCSKP